MAASVLYKANLSAILPVTAATTNATSVTTAATELFTISVYNANAALRYLKIYNTNVAPTVGTTVPVLVIPLKAGDYTSIAWAKGFYLSTGLAYALTTGAATADTAAVGTDITGLTLTYSL
jgi:hypothetical protein